MPIHSLRSMVFASALLLHINVTAPATAQLAPVIHVPDIQVEQLLPTNSLVSPANGSYPTCMVLIAPNEMLVGIKSGHVKHVIDNVIQTTPVLTLPAQDFGEAGLLSMALDPEFGQGTGNDKVYISYIVNVSDNGGNRIYSFDWNGQELVNRTLVTFLPVYRSSPSYYRHFGGYIRFGPPGAPPAEQKLFVVVGDMDHRGKTLNYEDGPDPAGYGSIWRINKDGTTPTGADKGPFYDVADGNRYLEVMYAYGIRNSFGMDFDAETDKLWITENGNLNYDEINLVEPGFNSGWGDRMGPTWRPDTVMLPSPGNLVTFGSPPVGTYADPVFSWKKTSVPTSMRFNTGTALGEELAGVAFVCAGNGIYYFRPDEERTGFILTGDLADKVFDPARRENNVNYPEDDNQQIRFIDNLGAPVDLHIGPDGNLYALSYFNRTIYKISKTTTGVENWSVY